MLLPDFDRYFKELLPIADLKTADSSYNGLQVTRENSSIQKTAFAVDACMESFKRAAGWGADMLFVHHGLFWGKVLPLVGTHFQRIKFLTDNGIGLYAVHLPLDMHPDFGNNAGLAGKLDLKEKEPFGEYKGWKIGVKGILSEPADIDGVLKKIGMIRQDCLGILPFGPEKIRSIGVISGGATWEVQQAMEENLDLYITGEISHQIYHHCLEGNINLIAGGHYQTETWGVRLLAEKTSRDTDMETVFLDVPTGL
jgi:dinuclear metal center YbgI/SA1388 family protein